MLIRRMNGNHWCWLSWMIIRLTLGSINIVWWSMVVTGPVISLSSSSWFLAWVGLELGVIGIIPLMFSKTALASQDAVMKFFCIQTVASMLILLSFYMESYFELFFVLGLMLKMAVFPGHFWLPSVLSSVSILMNFIILGPLKLAPIQLIMIMAVNSNYVWWTLLTCGVLSSLVGSFTGLIQTNLKSMIACSSIAHSGWIMLAILLGAAWEYFLLYMITVGFLLLFISMSDSYSSSMAVLSLSGLPPFLLFVGKLKVLTMLLCGMITPVVIILPIAGSVISMLFYLNFSLAGMVLSPKHSVMLALFLIPCIGVGFMV